MKKLRGIAALFLAFAIIATSGLALMPVYAEGEEIVVDETVSEEVVEDKGYQVTAEDIVMLEKLEAFGVISDTDVDLTRTVTRREVSEIIVEFMKFPVSDEGFTASPFVDVSVKDKAFGAIKTLYDLGVITGDENVRFHPDNGISYNEALVFVINALGYKTFAVRDGGFPTGYHRVAIKLDLLKGLLMQSGKDEVILRDMYKLIESALGTAAIVAAGYTEAGYLNETISSTADYLSNTYGIKTYKGVVTGNSKTSLGSVASNIKDEQIEIDYKKYDTPGYTYETLLGRQVYYYLARNDRGEYVVSYIEQTDRNSVVTINADDILPEDCVDGRIYYKDENDNKKYTKYTGGVRVIYNGRSTTGYGSIKNILPVEGYIDALDNTGDGVADILFIYSYRNFVVDFVDDYYETITADITGEEFPCKISKGDAVVYSHPDNKIITDINNIESGSVVTVLESRNNPKLRTFYVCKDTVTGIISEIASDGSILINDVYYKVADDYFGSAITIGMDATFFLNFNGKIVTSEKASGDALGTLGVMAGLHYDDSIFNNEITVKIFKSDGKFVTLPLSEKVRIDNVRYTIKSDKNEIVSKLAEGYMENGRYVLNSSYVLRFISNGSAITEIRTTASTGEGLFNTIIDGGTQMYPKEGMNVIRVKQNDAADWTVINHVAANSVVFACPKDGNVTDDTQYNIVTKLRETYYRPSTHGADAYDVESIDVYTFRTKGILNADVILLHGDTVSVSGVNKNNNKYGIVEKITSIMNEDGMVVSKVHGSMGELVSNEKVQVSTDNSSTWTEIDSTDLSTYIKPGYTVQHAVDAQGKLWAVSVVAEYDAATETVTPRFSSNFPIGNTAQNQIAGTVKEISVNDGAAIIECLNSMGAVQGEYLVKLYPYANYSLFRQETGEVRASKAEEIKPGDFIVAMGYNYFYIREIAIYK